MDPSALWSALAEAGPWAAALGLVLGLGYLLTSQLIAGIATSARLLAEGLTRQAQALERLGEMQMEARAQHQELEIALRELVREVRRGRDDT